MPLLVFTMEIKSLSLLVSGVLYWLIWFFFFLFSQRDTSFLGRQHPELKAHQCAGVWLENRAPQSLSPSKHRGSQRGGARLPAPINSEQNTHVLLTHLERAARAVLQRSSPRGHTAEEHTPSLKAFRQDRTVRGKKQKHVYTLHVTHTRLY